MRHDRRAAGGELMAAPTMRLIGLAAGVCVALFAIAFFAAGGGASEEPAAPAGEVRVDSPTPERVVGLRSIGSVPALARPRKRATPTRTTSPPPPPAAVRPPSVVRPPAAPPPPPPPPPPACLGALC